MEEGKREIIIIYLSLHCHHQNDSYIKTGSDESHFNVPLIEGAKSQGSVTNHILFEEKGKPKRNRAEIVLVNMLLYVHRSEMAY